MDLGENRATPTQQTFSDVRIGGQPRYRPAANAF